MPLIHDYVNYQGFKDPSKDVSILRDVGDRFRTQSLFVEFAFKTDVYKPLYTLNEGERDGCMSMYRIYMNSVDETDAAIKLVGNLRHWRKFLAAGWFMNGILAWGFEGLKSWRADMEARDFSLAKGVLLASCSKGDIASAKKLLDEYKKPVRMQAKKRQIGTKKDKDVEGKVISIEDKIVELHAKQFGKET